LKATGRKRQLYNRLGVAAFAHGPYPLAGKTKGRPAFDPNTERPSVTVNEA
jgi:hypothetical protein